MVEVVQLVLLGLFETLGDDSQLEFFLFME